MCVVEKKVKVAFIVCYLWQAILSDFTIFNPWSSGLYIPDAISTPWGAYSLVAYQAPQSYHSHINRNPRRYSFTAEWTGKVFLVGKVAPDGNRTPNLLDRTKHTNHLATRPPVTQFGSLYMRRLSVTCACRWFSPGTPASSTT